MPPRVSSAHRSVPACLIRSPRVSLLCLIRSPPSSAHRLAIASYRPAPRPIDTHGRGEGRNRMAASRRAGRSAGEWCRLLASPRMAAGGHRLRMAASRRAVIGGEWLTAAGRGCLLVLGAMGGAARSSLLPPSHQLIQSATAPLVIPMGLAPGSFHRLIPSTGRGLLFLFARPPPACSSRLAYCGLFPRPRPGDVRVAAWLAVAGWGGLFACLLSCPCCSLAAARSLVAIRPALLVSLFLSGALWGVLWGYFVRLLVGVGVFKYMPLNGILWLLMGIFGGIVRCSFSTLPTASLSPLCPAFRPFPVAVSWRWRGRFPAVSLVKRRVCVLRVRGCFPLLGSCGGWRRGLVAVPGGWCRLAACLPLSARASPAPWGGGLCEACGRRFRLR